MAQAHLNEHYEGENVEHEARAVDGDEHIDRDALDDSEHVGLHGGRVTRVRSIGRVRGQMVPSVAIEPRVGLWGQNMESERR